jgi:hypothetical protein
MIRQVVAYFSLIVMLFGAIIFIGGLCAVVTGARFFQAPLLLIGLVALIISSIIRWRAASG